MLEEHLAEVIHWAILWAAGEHGSHAEACEVVRDEDGGGWVVHELVPSDGVPEAGFAEHRRVVDRGFLYEHAMALLQVRHCSHGLEVLFGTDAWKCHSELIAVHAVADVDVSTFVPTGTAGGCGPGVQACALTDWFLRVAVREAQKGERGVDPCAHTGYIGRDLTLPDCRVFGAREQGKHRCACRLRCLGRGGGGVEDFWHALCEHGRVEWHESSHGICGLCRQGLDQASF